MQKNNTPDLLSLLESEPRRLKELVFEDGGWRLDFARVPVTLADWKARESAAGETFAPAIEALFAGAIVNPSENQPALHMALRATRPESLLGRQAGGRLRAGRERMLELAGDLHSGRRGLTDLIHVGIGGSDLGPRLVAAALDEDDGAVAVHWLATVDARRLQRLLARLDPATTGLVVASKSFSTAETLLQAREILGWLGPDGPARCWAATARADRAAEFGLARESIFDFPEWVGGRFSLWSAVGLSAAARVGPGRWRGLLEGAEAADQALREAGGAQGFAPTMALIADFLRRDLGLGTLGVVSYEPRLGLLADYLQQLVMESLGKRVDRAGRPVAAGTSPLVFGGRGTDLQHSLFQALHQGTDCHPMVLVGSVDGGHARAEWQREQLANLLGQATALVRGRREVAEAHRFAPGNRPVVLLLARSLDARSLGWLLAGLEHAVYLLGCLWRVNPFDQWGVEEGKRLAADYRAALDGSGPAPDPGLGDLLDWIGKI